MPTYEYACRDCGTQFDVVQSFRDDPLQTCEACGGSLRKVFSAAGIIFKGSGYYVTDTRAQAEAGAKKGDSPSEGGDGGAGEGGSAKSKGSEGGSESKSSGGKDGKGDKSGKGDKGGEGGKGGASGGDSSAT